MTDTPEKSIKKQDLIFQPVVPGITFPWSEASFYGFSLFVSTVFHELGHALAADCHDIKVLGYGLVIFLVIPAAFVDLSTSELNALSYMEQVKYSMLLYNRPTRSY